ncbi:hypothetical protein Tco_0086762 [Tanacetum coccineum]
MEKECFENDVVLDDRGSSILDIVSNNLPLLLKKKGRSRVNITKKRTYLYRTKIISLRKGLGKRVSGGANYESSLGSSRTLAVRALDELAVLSGETDVPKYMRFFFLQQIIEAKAFANMIRDQVDNARDCIAKFHVMICEMEAIDDSLVVFNSLDYLKESNQLENNKLKAFIAQIEEAIRLKEGHMEVMDLEINY